MGSVQCQRWCIFEPQKQPVSSFFPCPVCYLYVCLIVCVHQVLSRNDVQSVKIPFSNKLIVVRPGIWPLLWLVATMKTVQIDWNFVITEEWDRLMIHPLFSKPQIKNTCLEKIEQIMSFSFKISMRECFGYRLNPRYREKRWETVYWGIRFRYRKNLILFQDNQFLVEIPHLQTNKDSSQLMSTFILL